MSDVHLFAAAELADGHRYLGGFVAVCGTVLRPCGVPHETDIDPAYCPACVAATVRWNAISRCGHERPLWASGHVGACECDLDTT